MDKVSIAGKTFVEDIKTIDQAKECLRRLKINWKSVKKCDFEQIFFDASQKQVAKFYKTSGTLVCFEEK